MQPLLSSSNAWRHSSAASVRDESLSGEMSACHRPAPLPGDVHYHLDAVPKVAHTSGSIFADKESDRLLVYCHASLRTGGASPRRRGEWWGKGSFNALLLHKNTVIIDCSDRLTFDLDKHPYLAPWLAHLIEHLAAFVCI
jgi:hypothetical protein